MEPGQNLDLFQPAESPRAALARRLWALAKEGVYLGTSSWKYEGWLGGVYSEQRYLTRGRFSRKKFETECLPEYTEVFPAVCGDFTFYQFPSQASWDTLFAQTPAGFQFGFKATEEVTVARWPRHARYGQRGGQDNPAFLDAALFSDLFLARIERYRERTGVVIFEFGTFAKQDFASVEPFAERLARFLTALPKGWRYAVEIRNREYLRPAYYEALRSAGAAHVYNAWTRMPELGEQLERVDETGADFVVARALLSQGRNYEQAVKTFEPYTHVQMVNQGARDALREMVERSRRKGQLAFLFVNNRLEGHAPGTIQAVVDSVG